MTALGGWENFYVIVGSSAGALIGLQFVVMTLLADAPAMPGRAEAGNAFGTPTVVHFGAVLLLAAMMSVPWQRIGTAAALWGALGVAGVVYELIVLRRMRSQTAYQPEMEDWIYHTLFPIAAYATLAASALEAGAHEHGAMIGAGAAALVLLFVGIHNAWDAVVWHVYSRERGQQQDKS